MGWRDRDYAKWTDEERRRFYGSGDSGYRPKSSYATGPGQRRLFGSRVRVVPGTFLAVIVSLLAALALGQLPRSHPLIPALHFRLPALSSTVPRAISGTIALPNRLPLGSFLTLHGQLPAGETGTVTIEGAVGHALMRVLARVPATSGSYEARIPLRHRGLLHLRVTYPDGHQSVGHAEVR